MEKFDQNDLTIDADKDKIVNELKIEIASLKKENKLLSHMLLKQQSPCLPSITR